MRELLQTYRGAGIRHLVVLRGDAPSGMSGSAGEFRYAADLVALVRAEFGDWFRIEVAAYPETHPQARSPQEDVRNFVRKVQAGADSAITQYFYNGDAYFRFVDEVRAAGMCRAHRPGHHAHHELHAVGAVFGQLRRGDPALDPPASGELRRRPPIDRRFRRRGGCRPLPALVGARRAWVALLHDEHGWAYTGDLAPRGPAHPSMRTNRQHRIPSSRRGRAGARLVLCCLWLSFGATGVAAPALESKSGVDAPGEAVAARGDPALRAARAAALGGDVDQLAALAPQLVGHPLESYVAYWQASARLHAAVADDTLVRPFLERYSGTVLADRLRADWLLVLGARGDLATFDSERRHLVMSGDDAQLACYTLLARYALDDGRRRESLVREARRYLALANEPAGDGCSALADRLLDDGALPIWARLRVLVERGQITAAEKTALRLPAADVAEVARLLAKPAQWLKRNVTAAAPSEHDRALLAMIALGRDAPEEAAEYARILEPALSAEERALVWGRIGRSAQLKLLPQAHDWFLRGGSLVGAGVDYARANEVLEARARAALRRGSTLNGPLPSAGANDRDGTPAASSDPGSGPDWGDLRLTIAQMPPEMQSDSTWVYWNAQALLAQGRADEGRAALRTIAGRFSYYGRLAAEQLNLPQELAALPQGPDPTLVDELAQRPGFERARRLFDLGMRDEAMREWAWELRGMDDASLHAAAELGRRLGLLDRMIVSSERMRGMVDLAQRYPMPYPDLMSATSAPLGMDPAWIYGLIRQESRFMEDVRSNAGAIGLMQLMPRTASYVAHRIGFENYRNDRIAEVGVNLRLGTEYLKMVFDDQDGQALLASAAYNAGPHRVRRWRAALARPLDGAIFVETIPINETRDYVKRVLFNTVVYAALLQRPAASLQALLGPVTPKAQPATELP